MLALRSQQEVSSATYCGWLHIWGRPHEQVFVQSEQQELERLWHFRSREVTFKTRGVNCLTLSHVTVYYILAGSASVSYVRTDLGLPL